jgi:hypothetical protein
MIDTTDNAAAAAAASDDAAAQAAQAAAEQAAAAAATDAGADQGAAGQGDDAAAKAAETAAAAAQAAGTAEPEKKPAKAPKWAMDRIAEETEAKRLAREELARERAEKKALADLVEHLKRGNGGAAAAADGTAAAATVDTAAARVTAPAAVDPKRYEADVLSAAERLRFNDDCNTIFQAGTSEFKDFPDAVETLNKANVMQDDFLMDVLAADRANAHKVIHELAQNPEKAIQLARMPSRQRLAELVRMTTAAKPAPKRETAAPPPIKGKVEAVASLDEGDLSDTISDDEWSARFDKKYKINGHASA